MPVTRILAGGKADLQGSLSGTLRVGDIQSRSPMRWHVVCEQCGARSVADHSSLFNGSATCPSSTCRITPEQRQSADETIGKYRAKAEQQARGQAAEREEHERQKEAESASRLAEVQTQLNQNARELHRTIRQRIEQHRDDECYVDPATVGRTMGGAEAMEYNQSEAEAFLRDSPDYFPCPENLAAIGAYLERNGIQIASRKTLAAALKRLRESGLLLDRPKAAATPMPALVTPGTVPPAPAKAEATAPATAETFRGIDPATGEAREYTRKQVDLMSSDQYRRCFRLVKSDLELPRHW